MGLEDDPTAVELMRAIIKEHGRECFLHRVEDTRETFVESLSNGGFNLMLAPKLPLVFVSTSLSEAVAIAVFAQSRDCVRLLVTDMDMPRMDGKSLVRGLEKVRPDLRVIASAGQLSDADRIELGKLQVSAILDKPYHPEKLLVVTHKILDSD